MIRSNALFFACLLAAAGSQASNAYLTPAQKSAQWLAGHQNPDGSWGSVEEVKILYTSEAVQALAATNERNGAYWSGIAWLENQAAGNIDYSARRILALTAHGDELGDDLAYLQQAQNLAAPLTGAWGLTESYESAALDTALALQALAKLNQTANVQYALDWLKVSQLSGTDNGWALGQNAASDPVVTAQVILGLQSFVGMDGALSSVIANAAATLNTQVTTASPNRVKALAAIALIRAGQNPAALLDSLVTAQAGDGGVGNDVLQTALAGRTLAAAAGADLASLAETVSINDQALRAAINEAMGRNVMDHLNKGELAKLTSLNIANRGITDLSGLEWATNLATLDARNNQIASTTPIDGLNIASLMLDGNPVAGGDVEGDVPLPAWSLIALGAGLVGGMLRRRQARNANMYGSA
ncbi:MAG: hypothetical protein Q8O79_09545 [Pseudomonadota bacterium]|nr:hypothetical protein [Pseudomonadota bacterium]